MSTRLKTSRPFARPAARPAADGLRQGGSVPLSQDRITEAGAARITEAGQQRITEGTTEP